MKKSYDQTPFEKALSEEFSNFVENVLKEGAGENQVDFTRSLFVNAVPISEVTTEEDLMDKLVQAAALKDPSLVRDAIKGLFQLEVTLSIKGDMGSVLKEIDYLVKDNEYFNKIVDFAEASTLQGQPTFSVEALTLKSKPGTIVVEDKPGAKVSDGAN